MSSVLLVDEPAKHVRRLTLNRPEQLNAMTAELCQALHDELFALARERSCRAAILTGAGRGFCAGLDLHGYGAAPENDGSDEPRDNGPAAGFGLALALGCDIRYAAPEAVFRAAFINIGVSNCDMATSWLLPRLIGASRSHELMLTGRRVGAEEALQMGLVADVAAEGRLAERALEAAVQIASLAPWGVRLTKRGAWTALEIPSEQAAVEYEDRQQIMSTFGRAVPEAIEAFLQKRDAEFAD